MQHRYSLRFESGERKGESIPITGAGLTVGRKPGNTLQILDNSVSGSHAELVIEPEGVLLRDTGSTNGTRVGTTRVIEQKL
jgi:pSer/pThr/pTyr-binding forkhead associated (FHA) protein